MTERWHYCVSSAPGYRRTWWPCGHREASFPPGGDPGHVPSDAARKQSLLEGWQGRLRPALAAEQEEDNNLRVDGAFRHTQGKHNWENQYFPI